MHNLWIAFIGAAVGVLARLVAPGRKAPFGFILTALLGIIGAFALAYLGQEAGWYTVGETNALIGAAAGAVLALALWAFLFRSGRSTSSL